jgi:transcription initiation factor IIF auxiliary subunit
VAAGPELNVQIKDSVFDPNDSGTAKKVVVRERENTTFYQVFLYLEGDDLALVESVTYMLHETFPNPTRAVRRTPSNPNCQLVLWTWGVFTVRATVVDKRGFSFRLSHPLEYEKELPEDDSMYDHDDKAIFVG